MSDTARKLLAASLLACVAAMPVSASAQDAYDDTQSHPLRLAAYALHPVGFVLEWLVTRPIHFVVSQPALEPVFGHEPHGDVFDDADGDEHAER
jgi:hypothetical protein